MINFTGLVKRQQNLEDKFHKQAHFQEAFLAVRYRYRACSELNETFKNLYSEAMNNELYREWSANTEYEYHLNQCIYHFFMNALSVLESLTFCLYFVGDKINENNFPDINKLHRIKLNTTATAFREAFPELPITKVLDGLSSNEDYKKVDKIRNILAHRIIGRRNISIDRTLYTDGTPKELREDIWYIRDLEEKMVFDNELIQSHFDGITRILTEVILASLEFVKNETDKISAITTQT